jgi:hypothetical protein
MHLSWKHQWELWCCQQLLQQQQQQQLLQWQPRRWSRSSSRQAKNRRRRDSSSILSSREVLEMRLPNCISSSWANSSSSRSRNVHQHTLT